MRFIRKNGRVIPIRDQGEHAPKKDYKKGYGATGALAAAGSVAFQAGAAAAQNGLKHNMFHMLRTGGMKAFFGGRGKLAAGLLGGGIGLMTASKANAGYRIAKAPKGERMGELAKHTAAAAVGYKVGAWAGIPIFAHQLKDFASTVVSSKVGRPVNITWKNVAKAATGRKLRLQAPYKGGGWRDVTPKLPKP